MRKFLIAAGAAACFAAALPAIAAPATGQEQAQPGAQSGAEPGQQARSRNPNRRVCVNDRGSDSRIRRRICRTQAEWDALQDVDPSAIR